MWTFLIQTLGNFLGGPFIQGALDAWKAKLAAETNQATLAEQLAAKELELQAKQAELDTEYKIATGGYWWWPDHLMGYTVAIYFGKLLIWDKVLKMGVTDPLAGWSAFTANLIIGFYFGKAGIENVLKIWRAK